MLSSSGAASHSPARNAFLIGLNVMTETDLPHHYKSETAGHLALRRVPVVPATESVGGVPRAVAVGEFRNRGPGASDGPVRPLHRVGRVTTTRRMRRHNGAKVDRTSRLARRPCRAGSGSRPQTSRSGDRSPYCRSSRATVGPSGSFPLTRCSISWAGSTVRIST